MKPVGKTPLVAEMFVGALLYSTIDEAKAVLKFVEDGDVADPAKTVLATVRALVLRNTTPEPNLVKDDLRRRGCYQRPVAVWLNKAVVSGASASAALHYATVVVSEAFRARVESFGHALKSAADTASEQEVSELVNRAVVDIRGLGGRLAELRGESL